METREKEIKKYQTQLYQIKTNKEYMSLQKEIEGLKADNSVLEDDILESMERIDKLKAEIAEEKERLAAGEKELKEETEEPWGLLVWKNKRADHLQKNSNKLKDK